MALSVLFVLRVELAMPLALPQVWLSQASQSTQTGGLVDGISSSPMGC